MFVACIVLWLQVALAAWPVLMVIFSASTAAAIAAVLAIVALVVVWFYWAQAIVACTRVVLWAVWNIIGRIPFPWNMLLIVALYFMLPTEPPTIVTVCICTVVCGALHVKLCDQVLMKFKEE